MTTTSLKLPDELKAKAADIAKQRQLSPHAYMVEAIRRATEQDERHQQFIDDAMLAREEALKSGKGYSADKVHAYLRQKASSSKTKKPQTESWRK